MDGPGIAEGLDQAAGKPLFIDGAPEATIASAPA